MDIIKFVTEHQAAYRNWFMLQTFRARPKEMLRIPARDPLHSPADRFSRSELVITFRRQPDTHWATNVIEQRGEDAYTAYVYFDQSILQSEPELRMAVFAEEWLEAMVGIHDPHRRKAKRTASKISLVELYSALGRDAHWMDDEEEQIEKLVGLQHLLLPDHVIIDFINRYQTTVEKIKSDAENESTASNVGRTIRSIERSIATEKFLKLELVQLRLGQYIFSGGNGQ